MQPYLFDDNTNKDVISVSPYSDHIIIKIDRKIMRRSVLQPLPHDRNLTLLGIAIQNDLKFFVERKKLLKLQWFCFRGFES